MLKMERTCNSRKCNVLCAGELIGYMEGVNLTQWFIKNRYTFKGSFSEFIVLNHNFNTDAILDIIFNDKNVIARDVKINWINAVGNNGTFTASKIEYYEQ